jgi:hypothetical protein
MFMWASQKTLCSSHVSQRWTNQENLSERKITLGKQTMFMNLVGNIPIKQTVFVSMQVVGK